VICKKYTSLGICRNPDLEIKFPNLGIWLITALELEKNSKPRKLPGPEIEIYLRLGLSYIPGQDIEYPLRNR